MRLSSIQKIVRLYDVSSISSSLTLQHQLVIIIAIFFSHTICSIAADDKLNDTHITTTTTVSYDSLKQIISRPIHNPIAKVTNNSASSLAAKPTLAQSKSHHRATYLIHGYKEECGDIRTVGSTLTVNESNVHRRAQRLHELNRIRCAATLICFRASCRCPIGHAYGYSNVGSILSSKKPICYNFSEFPCQQDYECQDVDPNVVCHRGSKRCRCKNGFQFESQTGFCNRKIKNPLMLKSIAYNLFNAKPANQPIGSSSSSAAAAASYHPLPLISTIDSSSSLLSKSSSLFSQPQSSQLSSSVLVNSEPKFIFPPPYSSKSSLKSALNVNSSTTNQKNYFYSNSYCNSNLECGGEFTYCHRKRCKCWPEFEFIEHNPPDQESLNSTFPDLMLDSGNINGTGEDSGEWLPDETQLTAKYGMCRRKLCSSDFDCRTDDNPNLVCNTTICECRYGYVMYRENRVCVRYTIRRQSCDITCKVIGGLFASIFMLTLIYWCFYCCYSIVKNYRLQQLFANNRRNNSSVYGIDADGMLEYDSSSYFNHRHSHHHRGTHDPRIRTSGTILGTAGSRFSMNFSTFLRPLPLNDDPPSYSQATGDEYLPNYEMVMEMQALRKEENHPDDSNNNVH